MSIHKECADHLRASHRNRTGGKLGAGHAHEIVAAYFGYGTGAALRAEVAYPLDELERADILIPDLLGMDRRLAELEGLPMGLPDADDLASELSAFVGGHGYFRGAVWHTRNIEDYIDSDFIQKDPMMIEDDLAGEIALTNAYFDELYVEKVTLSVGDDELVATVSGSLNGEQDQDRAVHGDSIAFTTLMTFPRVAGRTAYAKPELETSGAVDDSKYYDEEDI